MVDIKPDFISCNNIIYTDLKNINFEDVNDLSISKGKYITETKKEFNPFFADSQPETEGVYIYQTTYDENKAFRLYKDWANNVFCEFEQHPSDAKMIKELIKRQKYIRLTDLPTGIVTLKGYTIGGAQISEKHAGFIINKGNATSKDIFDLIEYLDNVVIE